MSISAATSLRLSEVNILFSGLHHGVEAWRHSLELAGILTKQDLEKAAAEGDLFSRFPLSDRGKSAVKGVCERMKIQLGTITHKDIYHG